MRASPDKGLGGVFSAWDDPGFGWALPSQWAWRTPRLGDVRGAEEGCDVQHCGSEESETDLDGADGDAESGRRVCLVQVWRCGPMNEAFWPRLCFPESHVYAEGAA